MLTNEINTNEGMVIELSDGKYTISFNEIPKYTKEEMKKLLKMQNEPIERRKMASGVGKKSSGFFYK
ncbi:hypothetical protein P148_SR1C00001G0800 [candidate division SR1 bacterium RAAC1_SR1_1]|nr:hypothetical protein P148_SR1C00001G0800 [candidate division SR1 bacterium RAAC1_SR1_1]